MFIINSRKVSLLIITLTMLISTVYWSGPSLSATEPQGDRTDPIYRSQVIPNKPYSDNVFSKPLNTLNIPEDTVLVEYEGGAITVGDLFDRIDQMPSFHQHRFTSREGQRELLNMMADEVLFYLEAQNLGIDNDPEFLEMIDLQKKTIYADTFKKEYGIILSPPTDKLREFYMQNNYVERTFEEARHRVKRDYIEKQMRDYPEKFSDQIEFGKIFEPKEDVLRSYYQENTQNYPAATFEEARGRVKQDYIDKQKEEKINQLVDDMMDEYDIVIDRELLRKISVENPDNDPNLDKLFITSSKEEFDKPVSYLIDVFKVQRMPLRSTDDLIDLADYYTEATILTEKAMQHGLHERPEVQNTVEQVERTMMMRLVYNKLIVDPIDTSDESVRQYYEENIDQFSSRPYRKIQALAFKDKNIAEEVYGKVKKNLGFSIFSIQLKKPNEEAIAKLVEEYSLYPARDGVLNYIYQNDIIPGLGKDEYYSNKVWNASEGDLSEIFQNKKGEYVFFRMLEHNPPVPDPFEGNEQRIKNTMVNELSKKRFEEKKEQLKDKYNLKVYPDNLIVRLSQEEYFDLAEEAMKRRRYNDAVHYYDEIIKHYPEDESSYKASFMKAFLFAEEMDDREAAIEAFRSVIEDYPEGDLHESAQFMLDELTGNKSSIDLFEDE
jgi:TolA-binding protein